MDIVLVARFVVGAAAGSLLVIGVGVLVIERLNARPEPLERDTGPLALVNYAGILGFVAVGAASAATMVATIEAVPSALDAPVRGVGIVLVFLAAGLAGWGLRSIGRDMASAAEVRPDTQLVTGGAFAFVRHPLYLSILLLWIGAAAALVSWLMAVLFVLLVPVFVARSALEERLLVAHFGSRYSAYASRVPMLVPRPPWRQGH